MRPGTLHTRIACALFAFILSCASMHAQDIHFSQFPNATQQYNPALTGQFDQSLKATLLHRKQWKSLGSGFTTSGLDAQYKMLSYYGDNFMGFGLQVLQDNAGKAQMKTFSVKGTGSYHLAASPKNMLSAGVQIGYEQKSLDISGLAWDSQYNGISYDPTLDDKEKFLSYSKGYVDLGVGFNWRHKGKKKFNLGYAMHHAGQQTTMIARGNDRLKIRQTVNGSLVKKYEQFDMKYDVLVQREAGAQEIMVGATFDYRFGQESRYTNTKTASVARAGIFYRYQDAIHPFIGFEYKHAAAFTFGYDIRLTKMPVVTSLTGGPEISLTYLGAFGRKRMKVVH